MFLLVFRGDTSENHLSPIDLRSNIDDSHADELFAKARILCWIMKNPENQSKKAIHVKNTWGRRCNKLLFMSTKSNPDLGAVALPVNEGRNNLWNKTKIAFHYIYQNHLNDADFFMKADDDT